MIRRPQFVSAVAILHSDGSLDDYRLSDALAANGVAVVCVPRGVDFEVGLQIAAESFATSVPRMVAASGSAVPAAQRAARRSGLSGAVLLNAPVGRSVGVGLPATVFFVDRGLLATRMWGRMASRLGNASYHVVDTGLEVPLRKWLAAPDKVVRDPLMRGVPVAALVAAATLMAPLAAPAMATTAHAPVTAAAGDPFDGGVSVAAARIGGDSAQSRGHSGNDGPKADKATDAAVSAVPASAITGDGTRLVAPAATGSIAPIGGNGMRWFVNTNVTFSTSSSASAAMSEASFTAAVPATTSAGGTTMSTLGDGFDGYNTLFLDAAPFVSPPAQTGNAEFGIYNKTGGAATLDSSGDVACNARQATFPTKSIFGLDVSRKVWVPNDGNYSRTLNILTNPTGSPISMRVGTANNLGSDSNTVLVNTSDGDTTPELTDTWITSFQNYSGNTSSDPRLGHVLQGAGAPVGLSTLNFVNGDDNPYWSWDITVQPGETVTLMTFAVGEATKAAAATTAAQLAVLAPALGPLRCMTAPEVASVVNFAQQRFLPVTPFRAADTRGGSGGRLAAGTTRIFALPDRPVGATGATLNVTAVSPSAEGYLTVYPCDQSQPATSNVNYPLGGNTPNQVTTAISATGEVCVFTYAATDVLIDVNGWWTGSGSSGALVAASTESGSTAALGAVTLFQASTPVRVLDTRPSLRPAASTLVLDLSGYVPPTATAVSMNVTTALTAQAGYTTVFPCDQPMPNVSNVNQSVGADHPNLVTVKLAADKTVCIFVSSPTALIADLLGAWTTTVGAGGLTPDPTPNRAYDSRAAGGVLLAGAVRQVLPAGPGILFINLTATNAAAAGFATVFPCDSGNPGTSTVNYRASGSSSTAAIVDTSHGGVCVSSSANIDVIVDVFGILT